jgi:membrane protein implicated in regulation of membrane protease activity
MDFIQTYAWVVWLALILVFVILEVITVDFTFMMLAAGSVGGLIVGIFQTPFWVQVIVAAVLSLLLLFTVRPPLKRALQRGGDHAKSNVDALMGLKGTVVLDLNGNPSTVKLTNGETWTLKLADPSHPALVAGDHVVVTAITGSTAVVAPAERTAP